MIFTRYTMRQGVLQNHLANIVGANTKFQLDLEGAMLQDVWRPVRLYTFVQRACRGVNLQLLRGLKAFKTCCLPCLVIHSHVTTSNFCQARLWCSCKRLSSSPTCIPNTVQYRKKRVFSSVLLCYILRVTASPRSPTRWLLLLRCLPAPRTCVGL